VPPGGGVFITGAGAEPAAARPGRRRTAGLEAEIADGRAGSMAAAVGTR